MIIKRLKLKYMNEISKEPQGNEANTLLPTGLPEGTKCTAENCNELAIGDYNGYGDYACAYHMRKWDKEFENDYR
jgi:hypothetical protein